MLCWYGDPAFTIKLIFFVVSMMTQARPGVPCSTMTLRSPDSLPDHSGHLVLLNLKKIIYPNTKRIEDGHLGLTHLAMGQVTRGGGWLCALRLGS